MARRNRLRHGVGWKLHHDGRSGRPRAGRRQRALEQIRLDRLAGAVRRQPEGPDLERPDVERHVAAPGAEPQPTGPRIVRAPRYPVKPMSLEDAALRVDAGPDTFVVFRNPETDTVSILYRRKDGNLGLIEAD